MSAAIRRRARGALLTAAWLVAATACSRPPADAAPGDPAPWFAEEASARGVGFTHQSGHITRFLLPEIMGGGAALFDMDGDGDLDLFLAQSGRLDAAAGAPAGHRLYRNRGDGTFDDVTAGSGVDVPGYGMGTAVGDYDNDGRPDLYVTGVGRNALLHNDGGGRFTDVTARAGVAGGRWSTSATFFDMDADGDLDLFVVRYINWSAGAELECYSLTGVPDYCSPKNYDAPTAAILYRNDGTGTFTDVSAAGGLHAAFGNGLGVVAADVTGDGRADVYVANDGMPNQLWVNLGDGRFADRALAAGCATDDDGTPKAGMGVFAGDVDDDDDLDLLVVNLDGESDSFYRNERRYFKDDTAAVGLRTVSRPFTRFGMALLDFDNDGRLDLYEANGRVGRQSETYSADPYAEPNLLLHGVVGGRFEEVTPRGGTARPLVHASRAAAFGDIDNDGGIDVVVANRDAAPYLLRNVARDRGRWVLFRVLDEHGRDAIGATVRLSIGDRRLRRDVTAGYSYLASSDPRVHVGLGAATAATGITVRWADGREERFPDVTADRIVTLHQGAGTALPKGGQS